MTQPLVYRLTHSTGTVELTLTPERFVVNTKGTGLADKLRTIDIPVSTLRHFAVTPTTTVQNTSGTRTHRVVDTSRDAELLFSYTEAPDMDKVKRKRVFVSANDPGLVAVVSGLKSLRPDASLLHLPPVDAYKTIGVLSPKQGVVVVLVVLVGLPLLALLLWALFQAL